MEPGKYTFCHWAKSGDMEQQGSQANEMLMPVGRWERHTKPQRRAGYTGPRKRVVMRVKGVFAGQWPVLKLGTLCGIPPTQLKGP